ncbi:glycosyltransferase family 2 protein [Cycloclasticus pugetii]|uniref:glycosyltransferase family 2 protein n=1 Tax=Cycloclasticus pugetii TaxID=34068 RepID=UPI000916E233|nr:glycosyltransferase [Cycloclasticus pugetii]SHJ63836.1 Glycosyl transferase family 2 [Cycloclasticus pugetii]
MQNKQNTAPDLSMVMPCYNEEEILRYTLEKLVSSFNNSNYQLELIAVDNGSSDLTGDIIQELAEEYPAITPLRVDVNNGYGNGMARP